MTDGGVRLESEPVERWTWLTTRILAPNPGPMTLEGTNTFLVRHPDSPTSVVVDPGPGDPDHLERVRAGGRVDVILLTHWHPDHTESARRLAAETGAPVRAADAELCIEAPPLTDGEVVVGGGTELLVRTTPGHTADSVCLQLNADADLEGRPRPSILTGDTILGRGSTVIAQPDGSLGAYLRSLEQLKALGELTVLPAHGPRLDDLGAIAGAYLAHRRERLRQVEDAVDGIRAGSPPQEVTVALVTDLVYPDVSPEVRFAAESSVAAQLSYLAEDPD